MFDVGFIHLWCAEGGFPFRVCGVGHLWSFLFLCSSPVCVCCAIFSSYLSCSYRHIPVIYLFCSFFIPHSSFLVVPYSLSLTLSYTLSASLSRPTYTSSPLSHYLPTYPHRSLLSLTHSHSLILIPCGYISHCHPTRTQGQNPIIHHILDTSLSTPPMIGIFFESLLTQRTYPSFGIEKSVIEW